jgi:hypothetical protein
MGVRGFSKPQSVHGTCPLGRWPQASSAQASFQTLTPEGLVIYTRGGYEVDQNAKC